MLKVLGHTLELRGVGALRGRIVPDGADLVLEDGTMVTVHDKTLRVQKGNSVRTTPFSRLAGRRRTVVENGRITVE